MGGNNDVINDPDALKPDLGTEEDFSVENNSFAFSQGQLNKLVNGKSLAAFYALGGLAGLEKGLRTDRKAGLSVDEERLEGTVSFDDAVAAGRGEAKGANGQTNSSKTPVAHVSSASSTTHHNAQPRAEGAFADRKRVYKDNRLPEKKGKSLLQLMWITYNDKVLILLSIAAAVSLAVGLTKTFERKQIPKILPSNWLKE